MRAIGGSIDSTPRSWRRRRHQTTPNCNETAPKHPPPHPAAVDVDAGATAASEASRTRPRMTSRWIALPWRELRKSPIRRRGSGAGARRGAFGSFGRRDVLERLLGAGARRRRRLAAASSRAASISRALCASTRAPYFANSGEAFAGAVDVGGRRHLRGGREHPRVHDRRRHALLAEQRHRRLAGAHRGQQLADVVEVRRRVGRDDRAQVLRVLGRERAQRVLDAAAELRRARAPAGRSAPG